jgi:signal transduction histidine kinase
MKNLPEASIVRFFAVNGDVVGTGFLVAENILLTCAHVLAAMQTDENPLIAPANGFHLDFPLVAPGSICTAHVLFWQPPQSNGGGDIAVLQLDRLPPDGAMGAHLVVDESLWGHNFRAYGFPNLHDNGVWASGKLRAREATGWVQIEDVKEPGFRVQRGFSGSAVWDEQLGGVAGMVVAAEEDPTIRAAYIIPTDVLIKAWPQLGWQTVPACPYRGLFAFREQDAAYFFGREAFTQQMVDAVRRKSLLAIIGPSGSGKSSVVYAGLIPRLRKEGSWLIASFRPGTRPFRSLAAALMPLLEPQRSETDRLTEISKLAQRLQQSELALQDVVELIVQKLVGTHLLLVIDEFEELYTLCREPEVRQHFLDELLTMIQEMSRQRTFSFNLVLTLRADFIGQVLSYRPFADALQYADLKLGPMNRRELQDAIKKPAEMLHVQIEEGLTERILKEISREPSHLPLLEFALTLLWAKQKDGKLSHRAYEEIGGVEKALADHAEDIYTRLDENEQLRAQRIFVQLIHPGEGTEDTRRLATRGEVGEDNWELVVYLSSARLVVSGRDTTTGDETVELVHEALIRGWQRLQKWVEENREFRIWQERLRAALRQWEKNSKEDDGLLRGTSLAEATAWITLRPEDISQQEKAFLEASQQFQDEETRRWKSLYEEAERQPKNAERAVQQLNALYQAGQELGKVTEVEQAYDAIMHILEEYSQSKVIIRRYDSSTQELVLVRKSHHAYSTSSPNVRIKLSEGTHGYVAKEKRTLVHNQVKATDLVNLPDSIAQSLVIIPIMFGDVYYGNLGLTHEEKDHFQGLDVVFIEWLAKQLASTICRQEIEQERREYEQRALAAEEMSSFGQNAFQLVHRLKNDLGLVPSYIEDILQELEGQGISNEFVAKKIASVDQAVRTVLDLSDNLKRDLADFRTEEEYITLSPKVLLEEAIVNLTTALPSTIKMRLEVDKDVGNVRIIHTLVADILHHLLTNAIEAMPTGGEITLRAYNNGHDVFIEVSDTGIGIPSHQLSKIFDLFFSTKKSTGFGLWSARRNALKNHGDLQVESQPGQGATFRLLLPKAGMETL